MKLNLIVIRSSDMEVLARFYAALTGLEFTRHRHRKGLEHYGTELSGVVFEIYPKRAEADVTSPVRRSRGH